MIVLVTGSYERFLFVHQISKKGVNVKKCMQFDETHCAAHRGPITSLVSAGGLLVSGGSDDQMHLFDMYNNKDVGFLVNPGRGAVTALEFFTPFGQTQPANMLSGSQDGQMHIWKVTILSY